MLAIRTLGILGGMGPEATAHFYRLLIRNTSAAGDQKHIPVIIWADPSVPDRTAAVFGRGPSPAPALLRGLRALRRAGADLAVIPCLTAHGFLGRGRIWRPLPVVSLVDETVEHILKRRPRVRRAGLLASSGMIALQVLQKPLEANGIDVLVPDARDQRRIMEAIYGRQGIKAGVVRGNPRKWLRSVAGRLVRRGAGVIIAACTEIPLCLRPEDVDVPLLDPMAIAARVCILRAGAGLRRRSS